MPGSLMGSSLPLSLFLSPSSPFFPMLSSLMLTRTQQLSATFSSSLLPFFTNSFLFISIVLPFFVLYFPFSKKCFPPTRTHLLRSTNLCSTLTMENLCKNVASSVMWEFSCCLTSRTLCPKLAPQTSVGVLTTLMVVSIIQWSGTPCLAMRVATKLSFVGPRLSMKWSPKCSP